MDLPDFTMLGPSPAPFEAILAAIGHVISSILSSIAVNAAP
jgi:hypothetical protein